jgi:hypothetical protein
LAEGSSVSFKQHDCTDATCVKEVEMTFAMWLLNHANTPADLKAMAKCIAANTKAGGQTLLLFPPMDANYGKLSATPYGDLKFSEIQLKNFEETQAFVLKKTLTCGEKSFELTDIVYPLDFTKEALADAGFENFHILPTVPIEGDVKRAEFID